MRCDIEPAALSASSEALSWPQWARPRLAWAVGASACFLGIYFLVNWIASLRRGVPGLYFGWELRIPLVPVMIVPYLSEDVFFFFSPFLCRTPGELRRHGVRLLLAVIIAALFFLLFPLHIGWPREPVSGASGLLFALLRVLDRPYNLVPSLHLALLVLLWVVYSRRTRGIVRIAVQGWFVLIGISTVLTRQHHLIDVVTGLMLGWLCLYLLPDGRSAEAPFERSVRLAVIYAALASACLAGATLLPPGSLVLIWPAISLGVVSAGYMALGPIITRKSDGRIPPHVRLVLGPYLAGARVAAWLRRPAGPSRIAPGVLLGGHLGPAQARALLDAGVNAVLDLTAEFSEQPALRRVCYLCVPVLDLVPPSPSQLEAAVNFIEQRSRGGIVYVHCALGYSRSVCAVAAWLLRTGSASTAEQAIGQIKQARPRAVARAGQMRALRAFEPGGAIGRPGRRAP